MTAWTPQGPTATVFTTLPAQLTEFDPMLDPAYPSTTLFPSNFLWPEQPIVWTPL